MRLYHNPRCSKSRQAVKLLTDKGVSFQEHRYLEEGIMEEDLPILASLTGIIRKQEKEFKELDFTVDSVNEVIEALRSKPKLLERPVLVKDGEAIIGRPPEEILKLI
ncbi:MAG: arsenate reductase (glutaredoxin) [Candidatus Poseidoniaceae archaeon]|nr:arsenate reductase (glutaredoxin) [Candidatus Poseidoniaceae archaeon]MBL6896710.1 arsenate reductase (glutaredoxin) [Candidatus Poseidoniaceae archaeon]